MASLVGFPIPTSMAAVRASANVLTAVRTRANALLQSPLISRAKTLLLFYVVLSQYLKFSRHLRARGIRASISEFYIWISQVRLSFSLPG